MKQLLNGKRAKASNAGVGVGGGASGGINYDFEER